MPSVRRSAPRHLSCLLLAALTLAACPNQELAPITPCTVAGVSINASQTGGDQVDLLFVIDNSGSMAEEQAKLAKQIPKLVQVLTSGDYDGVPNANGQKDFTPVSSLHLGVISVDMGVNGQPVPSCAKSHGDEGRLLSSTEIAVMGVKGANDVTLLAPQPLCRNVSVPRFISFDSKSSSVEATAQQFSCISALGITGCGFEQQLEAMWRALAPSSNTSFSRGAPGQGAPLGQNTGFLRDEAVLAVIMVSDEEDCSSPDASGSTLYSLADPKIANVLCARNPDKLHGVQRYVDGLRSLKKAAYQDRVIFAGIVGVPKAELTRGLSLDAILALPDMRVAEDTQTGSSGQMTLVPHPTCTANNGAGTAAPARRMVEVARGFGENGVITSICEDDFGPALTVILEKIASKLTGQCLPRKLNRMPDGQVECSVVEIKSADDQTPCDPAKGRIKQLPSRTVDKTPRVVCEVQQLPVLGTSPPTGAGWYYDDFSDAVKECKENKQRIAFSLSAPLATGASARFECFQSVARVALETRGVEAINTPCDNGSDGLKGEALCSALSLPGQTLICVAGTCQLGCSTDADCQVGHVCGPDIANRGYCANPTCPVSQQG